MWLEQPSKTLSVAVAALVFGACLVTFGLLTLHALLG
jgi:hypothetical protein